MSSVAGSKPIMSHQVGSVSDRTILVSLISTTWSMFRRGLPFRKDFYDKSSLESVFSSSNVSIIDGEAPDDLLALIYNINAGPMASKGDLKALRSAEFRIFTSRKSDDSTKEAGALLVLRSSGNSLTLSVLQDIFEDRLVLAPPEFPHPDRIYKPQSSPYGNTVWTYETRSEGIALSLRFEIQEDATVANMTLSGKLDHG